MENKYYTPSIEEFHVGFEYEFSGNGGEGWSKEVVDDIDSFDSIKDDFRYYDIRVKYLDKDDIESLGFKYVMTSYDGYWVKDDIELGFSYDGKLQISKKGGYSIVVDIKNKSELKRLLTQLGINYA